MSRIARAGRRRMVTCRPDKGLRNTRIGKHVGIRRGTWTGAGSWPKGYCQRLPRSSGCRSVRLHLLAVRKIAGVVVCPLMVSNFAVARKLAALAVPSSRWASQPSLRLSSSCSLTVAMLSSARCPDSRFGGSCRFVARIDRRTLEPVAWQTIRSQIGHGLKSCLTRRPARRQSIGTMRCFIRARPIRTGPSLGPRAKRIPVRKDSYIPTWPGVQPSGSPHLASRIHGRALSMNTPRARRTSRHPIG